MKKALLLILLLGVMAPAIAQGIDDLIFEPTEEDEEYTDIVRVNFARKDARLAMLMSALVPGAGQFYADRSAFITYVFPVLELAMIGGALYFNKIGDEKTEDFEFYATGETIEQTFNYTVNGIEYSYTYTGPRYRREFQNLVQTDLINEVEASDIYDGSYFRLDENNTQHFYEDIGKYNKYIFGWTDWYHTFAADPTSGTGSFILDDPDFADVWIFDDGVWIRNRTVEDVMNGELSNHIYPSSDDASPLRAEYIEMRKEANLQYSYSRYCLFGLALNHLTSAIHAAILTNRVNRTAITQNRFQFNYYAGMRNNKITPTVNLSYHF